VGQTGEFVDTFIHNVHGTARIVDNCTSVIENFTYDGIGLDVRVARCRARAARPEPWARVFR
jgi:hypothetical protein